MPANDPPGAKAGQIYFALRSSWKPENIGWCLAGYDACLLAECGCESGNERRMSALEHRRLGSRCAIAARPPSRSARAAVRFVDSSAVNGAPSARRRTRKRLDALGQGCGGRWRSTSRFSLCDVADQRRVRNISSSASEVSRNRSRVVVVGRMLRRAFAGSDRPVPRRLLSDSIHCCSADSPARRLPATGSNSTFWSPNPEA